MYAFNPARVAYAAAAAEVFPVDAQITASAPSSFALATAITIPRSLKEPVGFKPSYFPYKVTPSSLDKFGNGISGVFPSASEIIGVLSVTGRYSLYFSSKPLYIFNPPQRNILRAFAFLAHL